jgi:RHS repeat-associated protein
MTRATLMTRRLVTAISQTILRKRKPSSIIVTTSVARLTGLYYYGARYMNPMASIWYGVDPLAEKYTTTGGYVYTLDNPIRMIDLDGRKWDESSVTQKNGNVTINLALTVAILNSSNKKFDLKKLGNVLSSQLQSSYGISYVEGMNYETENTY